METFERNSPVMRLSGLLSLLPTAVSDSLDQKACALQQNPQDYAVSLSPPTCLMVTQLHKEAQEEILRRVAMPWTDAGECAQHRECCDPQVSRPL